MADIIQAEFFNTNVCASKFHESYRDIDTRATEGSQCKTCVRFFDDTDDLTARVRQRMDLCARIESMHEETRHIPAHGFIARFRHYRTNSQLVSMIRTRQRRDQLLLEHLHTALIRVMRQHLPFAVEQADHTYRLARDNERHELLESILLSKRVWIFVFDECTLVFQSSPVVCYAM